MQVNAIFLYGTYLPTSPFTGALFHIQKMEVLNEENNSQTSTDGGNMDGGTPSPPRARKPTNRRSSVAIARRMSRASAAGGISLEEQLKIVPAKDEAPTDIRLSQVPYYVGRYPYEGCTGLPVPLYLRDQLNVGSQVHIYSLSIRQRLKQWRVKRTRPNNAAFRTKATMT